MKKIVTTIVLIPVGPGCNSKFICDTILSIMHYCTMPYAIIIIDDSAKKSGTLIKKQFDDITILTTPKQNGKDAGLYFTLSQGYSYAYENYDFKICLRMDTDALVTGYDFERDAIEYFNNFPAKGIIGSYRIDCNGEPRLFTKAREILGKEKNPFRCARIFLKHPVFRIRNLIFLRKLFEKSVHNGYEPGEHCMGGAYFISQKCIERLYSNNLLFRQELCRSILQEDQIFGLLIYSVGMNHGDFVTGSYPMGLRWHGLPCSPETLIRMNKKVIHSTRYFEDLDELQIREYFNKVRMKECSDNYILT